MKKIKNKLKNNFCKILRMLFNARYCDYCGITKDEVYIVNIFDEVRSCQKCYFKWKNNES